MKTLLITIVSALFFLLPITGFAAYVIHLKDGTRFVTDQYYEEGDQIKFKRYGGTIGIEKDRIRQIEETEGLPETKDTPAETKSAPATQEIEKQETPKDWPKEKPAKEVPQDVQPKEEIEGDEDTDYEKEKKALMEKYSSLRQRLVQAIKSGDTIGKEIAKRELSEVLKKLSELERKQKKQAEK